MHQKQSCTPPLVGDAHGPAQQSRPSQSGGLCRLPAGPPWLSVASPFLAPSLFPQPCVVSPQLLSTAPVSPHLLGRRLESTAPRVGLCQPPRAGQTGACQSIFLTQSRSDLLQAAPASIALLYFVPLLICWRSWCQQQPKVTVSLLHSCVPAAPSTPERSSGKVRPTMLQVYS